MEEHDWRRFATDIAAVSQGYRFWNCLCVALYMLPGSIMLSCFTLFLASVRLIELLMPFAPGASKTVAQCFASVLYIFSGWKAATTSFQWVIEYPSKREMRERENMRTRFKNAEETWRGTFDMMGYALDSMSVCGEREEFYLRIRLLSHHPQGPQGDVVYWYS